MKLRRFVEQRNLAAADPGGPRRRRLIAEALEDRRLLTAARLGDFVWNDLDGNGLQDAGEPGVAGVVVEAFGSQNALQGDGDDVSRGLAVTDATDHDTLDFDAIHAEDVYVYLQFRVPRDDTFTTRNADGDDTRDSDVYADGTTDTFFLDVSDLVWQDLDGDGLQDAGEPGSTGRWLRSSRHKTACRAPWRSRTLRGSTRSEICCRG